MFFLRVLKKTVRLAYSLAIKHVKWLRPIYETRETQTPITPSMWFLQKIIGFNRRAYWPVHFTSIVTNFRNIYAGIETCPGFMPGCYIQGHGRIYIGDYTQISCNVGMITSNHDLTDNRKHSVVKDIVVGRYCWIGMNVVVLPGVILGDYTIVAAGSVVSTSFLEGYCVVAGVPAQIIKHLNPGECVFHKSEYEYHGYIRKDQFEEFRRKRLNV
ncbi:MAG: putative acetyltransferase [Syntrophorhabdus sp. PtaU1.Bin153]|nr:MAG: putative acetyltransferase [Syntrophorhabdus sp. PtaU1.Bin153]